MNEELVERIERALKEATEDFEKQTDRIVIAFGKTSDSTTNDLLREIRDVIRDVQLTIGN